MSINPKSQEFGCTLYKELPLIENIDTIPQTDCMQIMSIHILEDHKTTELQDITKLQEQDT